MTNNVQNNEEPGRKAKVGRDRSHGVMGEAMARREAVIAMERFRVAVAAVIEDSPTAAAQLAMALSVLPATSSARLLEAAYSYYRGLSVGSMLPLDSSAAVGWEKVTRKLRKNHGRAGERAVAAVEGFPGKPRDSFLGAWKRVYDTSCDLARRAHPDTSWSPETADALVAEIVTRALAQARPAS